MALNYHRTVAEVFVEACRTYSHKPAFTCLGKTISFAELEQYTERFASYLQHHTQLEPGDRIAVQLPNVRSEERRVGKEGRADGIRDGHVTGVQTCALPI